MTTTAPTAQEIHLSAPLTLTTDNRASKYKQVTTNLTDYGAYLVLEQIKNNNRFASDLAHEYSRFTSWFPNKRVWAHALAMEAINRGTNPLPAHLVANAVALNTTAATVPVAPAPIPPAPILSKRERSVSVLEAFLTAPTVETTISAPVTSAVSVEAPLPFGLPIVDMIGNAQDGGAKRIKFRLQTASGSPVVIKPASDNAAPHNRGFVYVNDGGSYDNQTYYGKFDSRGYFHGAGACTPEIVTLLAAFAENPATVAAEYGRVTSNCCFCAKTLKDGRSVAAGYGPDCAVRYQLPY